MDRDQAYDLVKNELTNRFEIEPEKIEFGSLLFDDLGLDSIDALDMLAVLDREWNVKVNEKDAKKIRTVENVVDYIVNNLPEDFEAPEAEELAK